jgi:hypothetical protein
MRSTRKAKLKEIQELARQGKVVYQCCLCKQDIPSGQVCALVLVVDWEDEDKRRFQQWFAHRECFVKATGETVDVGTN